MLMTIILNICCDQVRIKWNATLLDLYVPRSLCIVSEYCTLKLLLVRCNDNDANIIFDNVNFNVGIIITSCNNNELSNEIVTPEH